MAPTHKEIMLTGGEPTVAKDFWEIVDLANSLFNGEVYLTTQNLNMLNPNTVVGKFKAVTFSDHDGVVPRVENGIPTYLAIMAGTYEPMVFRKAWLNGYSGVTINEDQFQKERFDRWIPDYGKEFSIHINRLGKCMDETIIMPNLTIINNFRPCLKEASNGITAGHTRCDQSVSSNPLVPVVSNGNLPTTD